MYFNIIKQQHCQLSHRYLIAISMVKFYKNIWNLFLKLKIIV